jgi:hypothetical protein
MCFCMRNCANATQVDIITNVCLVVQSKAVFADMNLCQINKTTVSIIRFQRHLASQSLRQITPFAPLKRLYTCITRLRDFTYHRMLIFIATTVGTSDPMTFKCLNEPKLSSLQEKFQSRFWCIVYVIWLRTWKSVPSCIQHCWCC